MRKTSGTEVGSASAPHRTEQDVGSIFKRTEIIGRGKFGVVYKGYHTRTKQVFAIKVLNLDSDEDEVEDVQREVQFLASMKQVPNITQYYGSYLKDTTLWIIIEYCAGGSLRTLLRPGKIDEKYIGVIMRELLIALKFIHKDNVIHRDLKAANVLITNDGQVKLCDFGVAAQLSQSNSRRHTMAGTPYWMAPEVIMEGVYYDTKVDIWSLGITTYEAATGNPPYCEVEALRAMQLITKSKPPRLEGRSYSPLLKEFIALCLDEDPKERLSAEELLKTKFIKAHKTTPTTLLKQLISRYLLFRDNNKSARESVFLADDYQKDEENKVKKDGQSNEKPSNEDEDVEVDVKWDFDSLRSSDYIMENEIDVEEIPEGCNNDWTNAQQDGYNYAYPEEDQFYYYPTSHNGKVYQGTTMGKTQQGTMVQNTTINAPLSRTGATSNFTSKLGKSVRSNPTVNTGTHNNSTGTSKKSEARVPKKLLELFDTNEVINEEEFTDAELPRINRNLSHVHVGAKPEDSMGQPTAEANSKRPPVSMLNNGAFHSQSTPALPVLQTKFNKSVKGPTSAVTTAPTPIEIEIPEELPTSALPTPSSTDPGVNLPTKPRSSTVSTPGPNPYQKAPGISRRLTVGTAAGNTVMGRLGEEPSKSTATSNFDSAVPPAVKLPLRTPSPHKLYGSHLSSPTKRHGGSPTSSAPPPMMKAMGSHGDNKEPFLQPLNTTTHSNNEPANSGSDKETSRVNRDFKRNNPNLKLQMPLPTTVVPHKLLDAASTSAANNGAAPELINQFGFNTSSASNIPVSMTPINEKHIDWGNKPKRVQSISNRKNSQTVDGITSTLASGLPSNSNGGQGPNSTNPGPLSSSSVNIASMFSNNSSSSNNIAPASSSQPSLIGLPLSVNTSTTTTSVNPNASTSNPVAANATPNALMKPPPAALNMDIFLDPDAGAFDSHQWTDKKPRVLQELEALLQMFEDGLPVIESALRKQLKSEDLPTADH